MSAPLVDQDARDRIRTDLASTLIVEAAAGTGKTTEMIARIIGVLRTGTARLSQIVAVTFTEKAAGEMKLRLRTELESERQKATGAERMRLDDALAELETAHIGTIHSFCSDLLRERPIHAKIDPIFEVAAEDQADRLYVRAFETWLGGALEQPDEGVRRMLRRSDPTDQLRNAGRALVERRDFAGAWRRAPFDRHARIDQVVTELGSLAGLAVHALRPDDSLARLFTKLGNWLAELSRREGVRDRDYDGLEAELGEVRRWWEWDYTGKGKLYGAELARADVVTRKNEVQHILEQFLADAGADLAALLHAELRPLVHAYETTKKADGTLDFLDLLAHTRDLLRDDPTVRVEMQRRFTHFFVDEFQDTDPLQVEILLLLCATSPVDTNPDTLEVTPGKLFVVGDPKQAIYRFRRADIALYEGIKRRLQAQGASLLHLTTSFRSVPAIQTAVNAAFAPVMTGAHQAHYVPLERHREDTPGQPAVVALPAPRPYGTKSSNVTNYAIEESYPDAVGAFIDYLLTSGWTVSERDGKSTRRVAIAPRHICLVFRRFQNFGRDLTRPYVRALEARSIPHVLVGGHSFHEREEVSAVRNALRAIEWPDDELSVYATLRGPFFSITDEDLFAFQHAFGLYPLRWRALDAPDLPSLPTPELATVASALSILGRLHHHRNRRPIAATLGRLLDETRAHAGIAIWPAGEQALANIFRVMDIARRYEASGATSFRSFIERLDDDAERGKQPDAPVVEEGTEGTRIMTAHSAKGLEFPVVILCDPCAPLEPSSPSRLIIPERNVWLEPLAGCVPTELQEHAEDVIARDREEMERLSYVAVTRARDLLVVPVVGDEERRGTWLQALLPATHPRAELKRTPRSASMFGCPRFQDDSVLERARYSPRMPYDSVAPGVHAPRVGTHDVLWFDPAALALERELAGGLRQDEILQADESNERATASETAHTTWVESRRTARDTASRPTLTARSVTQVARKVDRAAHALGPPITVEQTVADRAARPGGLRFGSLVHATLAAVDLRGSAEHVHLVARSQARILGAPDDEVAAAATAVQAALAHPLLVRAADARDAGLLRRESPILLDTPDGLIEGFVDLAFGERVGAAEHWTVIDFKTDAELATQRPVYEAQVRLYVKAIAAATSGTSSGVLLVV